MTDEASEEATGREREVLRTRRESRDRLGERAFALSLEQALGVAEPDTASSIRDKFGALEPDALDEARRTVAGRIVLKRDMGKLAFLVLRDRSGDIQLVVNQDTEPESLALLAEVDLGDIVSATGRVGRSRDGGTGSSCRCAYIAARGSPTGKGRRPVRSSKRTQASE